MDNEPTNAAAELTRHAIGMLNDEQWARTNGQALGTPDFIRYDRRRLTAQPPMDRNEWLTATVTLAEVSGGWPEYSIPEVLAVRGERLVVYRVSVKFANGSEIPYVVLSQFDEPLERSEVAIFFDPEDVDLAIAELDRVHADLEAEVVRPPDPSSA